MSQAGRRILGKMLDRLFAAIVSGPGLNCRPHNSRQRIDLSHLSRLKDIDPALALRQLLTQESQATAVGRVPAPPVSARVRTRDARPDEEELAAGETPEQTAARRAWQDQQGLLSKLRTLADEARTYEDDTGVWALNLGFPLLSLPPGAAPGRSTGARRILAPIAMVPVSITVRTGPGAGVKIECRGEEVDRITANEALLSWLEQQTGKPHGELFTDEEGANPWREVANLVRHAAASAGAEVPACFVGDEFPETIPLIAAPKSEEIGDRPQIIMAAVLGLYPMANQGLLRDTRDMIESGVEPGPVESFLRADATLAPAAATQSDPAMPAIDRAPTGERLIAATDPCQARAVALARTSSGLVIHGPPGTGKSQTITNIIGDHLARGERVLFVCDKRTAIDVVASRLEHLGLADLCAVIHDPQRDQRDLYRSIREQLERLADTKTHPKAEPELAKLDAELETILTELRDIHRGLMHEAAEGPALHALVGQWLELSRGQADAMPATPAATLKELDAIEPDLRETLVRASEADYSANPWADAAALSVEQLVSRPMDQFRAAMDRWHRAAAEADATFHESIPPFAPGAPLPDQAAARERLIGLLDKALASPEPIRRLWAARDAEALRRARRTLAEAASSFDTMRRGGDAELWAIVRATPPQAPDIAVRLGALEAYIPAADKWWGVLAIGKKSAAARVLTPLGLPLSRPAAERARTFYAWLRAVRTIAAAVEQYEGRAPALDAQELESTIQAHSAVLAALSAVDDGPMAALGAPVAETLKTGPGSPAAARLLDGLGRSKARAAALQSLEAAASECTLVTSQWFAKASEGWRRGAPAADQAAGLKQSLPTLEDVLRVREGLDRLPVSLAPAARALVAAAADSEVGLAALRRAVTEAEISRRLEADPRLRALDGRRMKTLFSRHAELEARKREKVRDAIVHRWVSRQRERFLTGTGSRLNPQGAEVKRRLAIRGRHAMRLRQVLALGRTAEGGDPLLDLRPIWMASPETVAQVFPRQRIFDVVIFDEASQCRLEEALPVLTRAGRVVIAGDPRQLPPTRFFESSLATSEAEEINTDQDLFEVQQGEVEDLLGAALGLDVQQSYLDVHYRSRNSDLIAFSNDAFYGSRLQPIPGHPHNRARFAPITLYPVAGVYDKRVNKAEAEHICKIIRDLLKRAEPPSIGVGCFNLAQRDLIVETLEEAAAQDKAFAAALAAARERRGQGSNEALFVKNLENVQGDERDHIIISTTYGPDPQGRFYRRFGPLAMPGGGRRLNVLVTRAREEVHIVTSIPPEVYRALPPVPQGQQAGGGWLLFSYLKFAEDLAARYAAAREAINTQDQLPQAGAPAIVPPEHAIIRDTACPSAVAQALGRQLADPHGVGSIVHWGNDGFCIDIAVRHPARAEDVTVGVLCDLARFPLAADPVEWDLFRTAILEGQGWDLLRLWSPVVFRDARGTMDTILARATAVAKGGEDPDAIRVS